MFTFSTRAFSYLCAQKEPHKVKRTLSVSINFCVRRKRFVRFNQRREGSVFPAFLDTCETLCLLHGMSLDLLEVWSFCPMAPMCSLPAVCEFLWALSPEMKLLGILCDEVVLCLTVSPTLDLTPLSNFCRPPRGKVIFVLSIICSYRWASQLILVRRFIFFLCKLLVFYFCPFFY